MPVHDRSAMTFHLSRGKLIGSLDLTTPLEAERPVGCPSGHIAAPLTSAIVIREAAHAGAEARVPDASKQHRIRHVGRAPAKAFHRPLRIRGSGAGRDTPDLSFCVLRSQNQKVDPAAQIDRYEPLAGVSTWSRTAPDIDPGTIRGTFNHASTCSETQYGHH